MWFSPIRFPTVRTAALSLSKEDCRAVRYPSPARIILRKPVLSLRVLNAVEVRLESLAEQSDAAFNKNRQDASNASEVTALDRGTRCWSPCIAQIQLLLPNYINDHY